GATGYWAGAGAAAVCAGAAAGAVEGSGTSPGMSSMSAPTVSRIRKRALQNGHVVGRPIESAGRRKPLPHFGQAVLIIPSSRDEGRGGEGRVEGADGSGGGAEGPRSGRGTEVGGGCSELDMMRVSIMSGRAAGQALY